MLFSSFVIYLSISGARAVLTKIGEFYAEKFQWSDEVKELFGRGAAPALASYDGYSAEELDNFVLNGYKLLFQELRPDRKQKRFSSAENQHRRLIYSGTGAHVNRVHWHWVPLIDRFENNVPVIHKTSWTLDDRVTESPDMLRLDKLRTRKGGTLDETYDLPRAIVRYNHRLTARGGNRFTDVYTFPTSSVVVQDQVFEQGMSRALVELEMKGRIDHWLSLAQNDPDLYRDLQVYWLPFSLQHMLESGPTGQSFLEAHKNAQDHLEDEIAGFLARLRDSPHYFDTSNTA